MSESEVLLGYNEIAQRLGVTESTVKRWATSATMGFPPYDHPKGGKTGRRRYGIRLKWRWGSVVTWVALNRPELLEDYYTARRAEINRRGQNA
jgi:predicted transcriptional regulator